MSSFYKSCYGYTSADQWRCATSKNIYRYIYNIDSLRAFIKRASENYSSTILMMFYEIFFNDRHWNCSDSNLYWTSGSGQHDASKPLQLLWLSPDKLFATRQEEIDNSQQSRQVLLWSDSQLLWRYCCGCDICYCSLFLCISL